MKRVADSVAMESKHYAVIQHTIRVKHRGSQYSYGAGSDHPKNSSRNLACPLRELAVAQEN